MEEELEEEEEEKELSRACMSTQLCSDGARAESTEPLDPLPTVLPLPMQRSHPIVLPPQPGSDPPTLPSLPHVEASLPRFSSSCSTVVFFHLFVYVATPKGAPGLLLT